MKYWISVKDRLPKESGRYLVYEVKPRHMHNLAAFNYQYPCCDANIAYYKCDGNKWEWSTIDEAKPNPTHWMPLPEAPEGIVYK